MLNGVFSGVLDKIGPPPHFSSTFSALFLKIAFFGIFEHVTSIKLDVRPKIDVIIDVKKIFFEKKKNFKNV